MTKTRTATARRRRQALTDMATATEGERRPPGPNRGSGASQLSSRQTCKGEETLCYNGDCVILLSYPSIPPRTQRVIL